mmetsp:Transcript_3265/g.3295  ORF Transcript_3265/g.3295 Transcript_3265/m.3295 type:complete len:210 (+) Transcript_3265:1251-1880(+)
MRQQRIGKKCEEWRVLPHSLGWCDSFARHFLHGPLQSSTIRRYQLPWHILRLVEDFREKYGLHRARLPKCIRNYPQSGPDQHRSSRLRVWYLPRTQWHASIEGCLQLEPFGFPLRPVLQPLEAPLQLGQLPRPEQRQPRPHSSSSSAHTHNYLGIVRYPYRFVAVPSRNILRPDASLSSPATCEMLSGLQPSLQLVLRQIREVVGEVLR